MTSKSIVFVTRKQSDLCNRMLDAIPVEEVSLRDILTAGALFLTIAIKQAPNCIIGSEEIFQILIEKTKDLSNV